MGGTLLSCGHLYPQVRCHCLVGHHCPVDTATQRWDATAWQDTTVLWAPLPAGGMPLSCGHHYPQMGHRHSTGGTPTLQHGGISEVCFMTTLVLLTSLSKAAAALFPVPAGSSHLAALMGIPGHCPSWGCSDVGFRMVHVTGTLRWR